MPLVQDGPPATQMLNWQLIEQHWELDAHACPFEKQLGVGDGVGVGGHVPEPGSSWQTTSFTKSSTVVSRAVVSLTVKHPPGPNFASAFAKQPFSGFAPPSN